MAAATVSPEVVELRKSNKKLQEGVEAVAKEVQALSKRLNDTPAPGSLHPGWVFGQAHSVRTGEDPLTSRGLSFVKMFGYLTGALQEDQCKVERDLHDRMHQVLTKDAGNSYQYGGRMRPGEKALLAPLASGFMMDEHVDKKFRAEMKHLVCSGVDGADLEEMGWLRQMQYKNLGYGHKTLSWINDLTGGALVQPPEQGELIELLRNKEALVNAGARTVPLPPQGRMQFPKQTGASLTFWVGENSPITPSDIQTGQIQLQAKKLAVFIKAPNELVRFASPAAEALLRDDMTKSLALGLDLAGLEGLGGDNRPLGLIHRQSVTRLVSSRPGDNGDLIVGNDIYRFPAAVEEANSEFQGFVMRPKTLFKYYQLRFDAVSQGDTAGGFLFNLIREAGDGVKPSLAGYPVTKSTQISQVQTKGAGTGLTYIIGGKWDDMLIGMFGAIEFAATNVGDTPFINDQTWVRGILSADINVRHEASFAIMQQLITAAA